MNLLGSNSSDSSWGSRAESTFGEDSGATAAETPIHELEVFLGSSSRMPIRSACQPKAASFRLRISSASRAKTGLEDQRRNARTPSPDKAAAWRRHCRIISERF